MIYLLINFDNIELSVNTEFKGGVGNIQLNVYFDGVNKIMRGTLEAGASIGYHTHETNSEIIFILSGDAKCLYDDTTEYLKPGECHYCPLGHSHSLINNSDTEELCFLAVVPEHNA